MDPMGLRKDGFRALVRLLAACKGAVAAVTLSCSTPQPQWMAGPPDAGRTRPSPSAVSEAGSPSAAAPATLVTARRVAAKSPMPESARVEVDTGVEPWEEGCQASQPCRFGAAALKPCTHGEARSVADVLGNRAALAGHRVSVRGLLGVGDMAMSVIGCPGGPPYQCCNGARRPVVLAEDAVAAASNRVGNRQFGRSRQLQQAHAFPGGGRTRLDRVARTLVCLSGATK